MKSGFLSKKITGLMLTKTLLFVIFLAGSGTAQAQYRDHNHDNRYPGGRDSLYRVASEYGYRDGVEHGAEHRREGHRYDYTDPRHYKDATNGYRSEYGSKEAYKQAYREAFRQGYDEGYRGYSRGSYSDNDPYYRSDRNHGYGDDRYYGDRDSLYRIASENGYRDGVEHGAEHRREGHRYDYAETRHYKDATSGYRSEYGSKEAYKQAYREAFRQGYDEGFRGNSRGGYNQRNSRSRFPFPWRF